MRMTNNTRTRTVSSLWETIQRRQSMIILTLFLCLMIHNRLSFATSAEKCDDTNGLTQDSALSSHHDTKRNTGLFDTNHMNFDEEITFSPIGMQEFTIHFNKKNITMTLVQTRSAHCNTGADDTGLALWGPSVTLSQYLISHHPEMVRNKRVMEIGCGLALPSLVAYKLGASHVVSTDFRQATLDHVRYHSDQNRCQLDVLQIDWEQSEKKMTDLEPDIILAADVVYGLALVPALVRTIERYLPSYATLIICMKDGREGIDEFRYLMKQNFDEIFFESNENEMLLLPEMPPEIENDVFSRGRWGGNHSIYTYQWQKRTT